MMDNITLTRYNSHMEHFDYKKRDGFKGEYMVVLPIEVFSTYAEHPLVKRMYLTDVGYFPHAEHHYRERKEGIEEYIFLYCTAGQGTVIVDGRIFQMKKHEALCIPRHTGHRYFADAEDPWSLLWVHFKGEETKNYPLEACRLIRFESADAADRMMFLFDLLFRVLDANYTEGNFIYLSQVLQLILSETYYREKTHGTQIQNEHVTKIIRYMYRRLEQNLTLNDITKEFDLSKSYLNTIFQEYTQHAPLDFYINLKMKHACGLLRSTSLRIYEVAARLGYEDPYYFSRIFKKVIGISPRNYRNSGYFAE